MCMKTKLLYLLLITFGCLPLAAQENTSPKTDESEALLMCDQLPVFPGGNDALFKFIRDNVVYPVSAREKGISGRVIVQFVISKDGSVIDKKIVRGVEPSLDAEALRVVGLMPKWTPGMNKGEVVSVRQTIPIVFALNQDNVKPQDNGIVIPKGQEVTNQTLQGVWQACNVRTDDAGYHLTLGPILKILSANKTFMNIFIGNARVNAAIMTEGSYKQTSKNAYVENIQRSVVIPNVSKNSKTEITFEFLHNNLVKFTFMMGYQKCEEYWCRVLLPTPQPSTVY